MNRTLCLPSKTQPTHTVSATIYLVDNELELLFYAGGNHGAV